MSTEKKYPQIGDRVAVYPLMTHYDEHHVYVYGFGVYEAYTVPPVDLTKGVPFSPSPQIRLDDNRGTIWGFECFFTFEAVVKDEAKGREIVLLDIQSTRDRWARKDLEDIKDISPN